jgi:hypothetical protein
MSVLEKVAAVRFLLGSHVFVDGRAPALRRLVGVWEDVIQIGETLAVMVVLGEGAAADQAESSCAQNAWK